MSFLGWPRRLCAVLAVVMVAVACTGGSGSSHPGSSRPAFGTGGTLVVGEMNFGLGDPQIDISSNALELGRCCLLRTLLSYNGRSTAEGGATLRPDLATALPTVSGDGLTWIFHIKAGLHYAPPLEHTEIVAQDFIRSMEREVVLKRPYGNGIETWYRTAIRGADAYAKGMAGTITGMVAPNDRTLVMHLRKPTGDLGYKLAVPVTAPIPPNPARPVARFGVADGHDGDYQDFLVATGPYMFAGSAALQYSSPPSRQRQVAGVRAKELILVRNPSWSRATDQLRGAYADRIEVRPVGADTARAAISRLASGRIDVLLDTGMVDSPYDFVRRYQNRPALSDRLFTNQTELFTVSMNVAVPPFDELNVRRAVSFAVDREPLVRLWERNGRLVEPALHLGLDSTENDLLLNYRPYGGPDGSVRAAEREMSRSRYDGDGDGVCDATVCRRVEAVVRNDPPYFATLAADIASDLRRIGIHLRIRSLAPDSAFTVVADPARHAAMSLGDGWGGFFPSASEFFPSVMGNEGLGGVNLTLVGARHEQLRRWGYSVGSVPSIDDRIRACIDLLFAEQVRCWADLDQYVMERVAAMVPVFFISEATLVSARVKDFSFDQSTLAPALDQIALRPRGS